MFEGGSWLYFKKAADWIIIDNNTFKIKFDENMFIHYKIQEAA